MKNPAAWFVSDRWGSLRLASWLSFLPACLPWHQPGWAQEAAFSRCASALPMTARNTPPSTRRDPGTVQCLGDLLFFFFSVQSWRPGAGHCGHGFCKATKLLLLCKGKVLKGWGSTQGNYRGGGKGVAGHEWEEVIGLVFFLSILHGGGKIIPKDATFLQMTLFCTRLEQNLLVLTKVENILFVQRIMNSLTFFRFWVSRGKL